jgi:hypothetical protein
MGLLHPPRDAARSPSFLDGVRLFFDGAAFLASMPSVWGFALIPAGATIALLVYLEGAFGAWLVQSSGGVGDRTALVAGFVRDNWGAGWGVPLIALALVVVSAMQPATAFALDVLTRARALRVLTRTWEPEPPLEALFRALAATVPALAVALPLLYVLASMAEGRSWPLATALALVVAGLALAWNFIEYPASRSDSELGHRFRWMRRHVAVMLGFGLTGAVLLLIPGLGLFVLPVGVSASVRVVQECERADAERRALAAAR